MKTILRRSMTAAALVAAMALTASCSWFSNFNADNTLDWSADKLYTEARSALDDSNWSLAKEYYTKLESRYPFGRHAQQAQLPCPMSLPSHHRSLTSSVLTFLSTPSVPLPPSA